MLLVFVSMSAAIALSAVVVVVVVRSGGITKANEERKERRCVT